MKSSVLTALCAVSAALAAPLEKRVDYAIKDKHFVPDGWRQLGRAHPESNIELRIGLKQNNFDELEKQLYEVSDPDHESYGNHLSAEKVHELIAPAQHAVDSVHDWLEENSVRLDQIKYSKARDWLVINLPVSEVESLLDTVYHVYENEAGTRLVRTVQYSMPRSLHDHVDVVQPTNYFGDPKKMARLPGAISVHALFDNEPYRDHTPAGYSYTNGTTPAVSAVCNESSVTSLCLRTLYNTIDYKPQVPQKNWVATTNYLNETANYSDFHVFMSMQRKDAEPKYQYDYVTIANGINNQNRETEFLGSRDLEANLDVQTVGGIVYHTRFTTYSAGGSPPFSPDTLTPTNTNEPYLAWADYILSQSSIPYTITTSYGDNEQTVPLSYAKRVCAEFAQMGARGTTLFFSSGDNGVGANGTCISNDGKRTKKFLPSFPASCPYVTTVGGTRNVSPEIVAYDVRNGYVAGGGLSDYFLRPTYQDSQVESYLASIGSQHKGLYNASGRAYPDISAQGYRYLITYDGKNAFLDGTSASSPAAVAVLTNVNDALIAAGKKPLGFLNPWLYKSNGAGFNDIVNGNIWGCDTAGFAAKKGWDLATGFETPDFKKIRNALLGPKGN